MSDEANTMPEIHVDPGTAEIGDAEAAPSAAERVTGTARRWTEEIEVAGGELVDRVRELIAEGNVRRLVIRRKNGPTYVEVPLTAGALVGGVVVLVTPVLAALGALAALVTRLEILVEREGDPTGGDPDSLLVFDDEVVADALAPEREPQDDAGA